MSLVHFVRAHRDRLLLGAFAGFLCFYLSLFENALIDDTFITLTYARNLALHGTWGFLPGHIANTATSPSNVIILAVLTKLTGMTTRAPIWLALVCFAVMGVALDRLSMRLLGSALWGRIATLALVFNPLLVSTMGLESILFVTLMVLAIWCFVTERWSLLGFTLGMLSVTRADGILLSFVFLFLLPTSRSRLRTTAVLLVAAAPWYIFSWIHLGSLVPDTLLLRLSDGSWKGSTFLDGPTIFLERYPLETGLSFAYLPLALMLLSRQVRDTPLLRLIVSLAAVHFLAYALLRVPPYHWYFAPEAALVILFGALSLGVIWRTRPRWQLAVQSLAALALLVPSVGMLQLLGANGFRMAEMPIHSNLATHAQFKAAGTWLRDHVGGKTVLQEGEIGTLAYYCECLLLDPFSDRTWIRDGVARVISRGGLPAAIYAANFRFLRPDTGFAPYSYSLAVREVRAELDGDEVMHWLTSTRWAPNSEIILRAR